MGYGQYERYTRRRRNNTSLTVTIIALVVCLVLALTGFALSLTGAKRAAQELNDKNAQQEARISELEKQLEQSDVNALKEEIERLQKELEKANADKEALQEQINELNRRLEAKQQQNGELAKKKLIALTFDDGPGSRTTPELLDFLKEHNVKATFFVIGINAKKHKDILARMAAEGHVVGNHSDQHKNLKNLGSVEEIKKAVSECNEIIKEATGEYPVLLRPPGGSTNALVKQACKEMGMSIILWRVDTLDWKSRDKDKILEVAFDKDSPYSIRDGAIVLMHDIYPTTVAAAKEMILRLESEGYTFVTVPQLLQARGGMEPGNVYHYAFPS